MNDLKKTADEMREHHRRQVAAAGFGASVLLEWADALDALAAQSQEPVVCKNNLCVDGELRDLDANPDGSNKYVSYGACPDCAVQGVAMRTFTMYRRNVPDATHNANQKNASDQPQFEGVEFSDGRVAIRWLTAKRSTSCWDSMADMLAIHGHPEYGSELVWHCNAAPQPAPPQPAAGVSQKDFSGEFRVTSVPAAPTRMRVGQVDVFNACVNEGIAAFRVLNVLRALGIEVTSD